MNAYAMNKLASEIIRNFSSNGPIQLEICKDAKELNEFYNTYRGPVEFLYIASEEEIRDAIRNNAVYFTVKYDGELAGVTKASQLELPYPFFCVPKNMSDKRDYWGFSGLYVHEKFRSKKLSTILLNATTELAGRCGAAGIYADFDYRNIKSMRLISKYYNLLGYTDGRNGSPDEATIYTTFFKDFTGKSEKEGDIQIDFGEANFDDARRILDDTMKQIGDSSVNYVDYDRGYNEIVCFDTPHQFEKTSIRISDNLINKLFGDEESLDK